ncbi:TonB-linked outer membrane protein, SusC/RagA family [Arenibacter nanhaiticus]|uniref:TonB-linked outer membrane protein, SusC/RagA family n=1 Tax=Arenibacter nanhaiticus TaxID=558155 RepID=A0A1M6N0M4_9FLAO|nr:TonB-dependent receptor [Arenibacter nanhaiticus]SHJ89188.1 TonB-linked outer membrane protein, SusC/RagA family [Arenibacter nanhaiticus]
MDFKLTNARFLYRKQFLMIIMRTFIFLCFFSVFGVTPNNVLSQNSKIIVDFDRTVTVDEVFRMISDQSDYEFIYHQDLFKNSPMVRLKKGVISANDLLEQSISNDYVNFEFTNENTIIIKEKGVVLNEENVNQQYSVSGVVLDQSGQFLPGANILEKGRVNGTQTDFDGKFSITVVDENAILIISYLGFIAKEVSVKDQTDMTITLEEDATGLDEVVLVGYGSQKKINLTGSVATVSSKDLDSRPATDVSNLLTGFVPGVTVLQSSGQPGADTGNITIRGLGTLNSTSPLFIVDGMESTFQNIDPNDIENISILKDAAASAIYGVRAANGVVLITTKRGVKGKLQVNYNTYIGFQKESNLPYFLGSADFATLFNEALVNDGQAPFYSSSDIDAFRNGNDLDNFANTDQINELFSESGFQQNHHVSLAGGDELTKYAVSVGYLDRNGLMKNTSYDRYSVRVNLDREISTDFNIGVNLALTREDILEPSLGVGSIIQHAFREPPTVRNRFSNGLWGNYLGETNSLAEVEDGGTNKQFRNKVITNFTAEYQFLEGLKLKGIAGVTNDFNKGKNFGHSFQLYGTVNDDSPIRVVRSGLEESRSELIDINLQALLTYEKTFGDHAFNTLLGYNQREITQEGITAGINDLPSNNALNQLNAGNQDTEVNSGGGYEFKLRSVFGRFNYIFIDKYLFEANFRYDGTSRFASDDRFSVFPSFSAGWKISEENFFASSAINKLKLRASWGQLGNEDIRDGNGNSIYYPYQSTYVFGKNYVFGGALNAGVSENLNLVNPSITWEVSTNVNLGLDAGLFNNKLTLTLDYFTRETKNILMADRSASLTLGANPAPGNFGVMKNKGIEVTIGHKNNLGDDLNYYVNGNFSLISNELSSQGTGVNNTANFSNPFGVEQVDKVGSPINSIFGYEAIGIFQSQSEIDSAPDQAATFGGTSPGDLRYRDVNGDNVISSDDRVVLGNAFPEINYGIQMGVNYKNFDLGFVWQGVGKVTGYLNREAAEPFFNAGKALRKHLDRWTPDNPNASYPRLSLANSNRNNVTNSFFAQDASYLRLRNLQVGYSLPSNIVKSLGIQRFRLNVSADNLWTITSFEGFDPEAPIGRGNYYPQVTTLTTGLNISF